jgi:hypothetical protein
VQKRSAKLPKGKTIRITADFSAEILKAIRAWNKVF